MGMNRYGVLIYEIEHSGDEADALAALRAIGATDLAVTHRDYNSEERIAVTCSFPGELTVAHFQSTGVIVDRVVRLKGNP